MTFSSFQHGSIAALLKNEKNKLAIVVKGSRSIYVVMSGLVILLSIRKLTWSRSQFLRLGACKYSYFKSEAALTLFYKQVVIIIALVSVSNTMTTNTTRNYTHPSATVSLIAQSILLTLNLSDSTRTKNWAKRPWKPPRFICH